MRRTGAGIATLRGQEVLLIRRGDNGLWDIPGGGKGFWESPERAACRELGEETGLTVGAVQPLSIFRHTHTYPDGNVVDWTTHVFTAEYAGGETRAAGDAAQVRWWPLDALPGEISTATGKYFAALRGSGVSRRPPTPAHAAPSAPSAGR
ncbi:NUDIX domain-containing protein [Deinococcus lacus]|uniref:NUDIX domain-containing protein n=1 Tax=Deinococcus lacus TaxID=392561 RepID=A0ABW1YCM3_9DEIO